MERFVLVLFLSCGLVDSDPGEPYLICSQQPITARVGDDVVLQCHLEPSVDVTDSTVEWRHEDKIIHVYRNRKDDPQLQDERFRGRTSLFHQEMTIGKISLKLSRVTEEDSGEFTCFIPKLDKGRVTLDVGNYQAVDKHTRDWGVIEIIVIILGLMAAPLLSIATLNVLMRAIVRATGKRNE